MSQWVVTATEQTRTHFGGRDAWGFEIVDTGSDSDGLAFIYLNESQAVAAEVEMRRLVASAATVTPHGLPPKRSGGFEDL